MSRQLARLGGGVGASPAAPASIDAVSIKVGETFIDSQALRTRVERLMLAQGRQCRLDKRMSGGPGKLLRCSGAIIVDGVKGATGCSVLVRAYNKRTTKEWRVTEAILDHAQCTGQSGDKKKRPCRRSVEEEAAKLINANHKISSPALVKTLKATAGVDILERTANRVRSDVLRKGKDAIASQYQLLDSYLSIIGRDNGNIVECEWDDDGNFKSCFMMLGAAAHMATAGVQQDANNNLIHVATVAQAKEDASLYMNLLTKAMKFPELRNILNNPKTTCFTDKHKGSDSAVPRVCPLTEDRRCVEHLIKNTGVIGHQGRYHVYQAAKAATHDTFKLHMQQVRNLNEKAHERLNKTPHGTWANYACRKNVIWDQTTSNMAESVNNVIGAECWGSSTTLSCRRLGGYTAAKLKVGDPTAVVTPFATRSWDLEFKWSDGLSVSPTGGGRYMVYPRENSFLSNRVNLKWGAAADDHEYDCACDWPLRFKVPCRHVLAVTKATETANRALELVDKGYSLAKYRAAADSPNYRIIPPVWIELTTKPDHGPPLDVEGKSGRPKKGPRKKARIESNGARNTSSRTYALYDPDRRAAGGVGVRRMSGGATGTGGGGEPAVQAGCWTCRKGRRKEPPRQ
eukprot:jgi/Undpi1/5100/HiC_scaffold_19.g08452.m1